MNSYLAQQVMWRIDSTFPQKEFILSGVEKILHVGIEYDAVIAWFESGVQAASIVVACTGQGVPAQYTYVSSIIPQYGSVLHFYYKLL